jgi:hypothetical protein
VVREKILENRFPVILADQNQIRFSWLSLVYQNKRKYRNGVTISNHCGDEQISLMAEYISSPEAVPGNSVDTE